MTEFRRDPLLHRWVITGFKQTEKAEDFLSVLAKKEKPQECPFCEGKEFMTPPETYALRKAGTAANGPGWDVRVVPNRNSDLRTGELQKRGQTGVYDLQNAVGIHETVIETGEHVNRFSELSPQQIVAVLKTFQQRNGEHKKNHLLKGVLIYKNQGRGSAGLFDHARSNIISLPFIPKAISDELEGAKRYYDMKTRCVFCDMILEEQKLSRRVVLENSGYFAWCPFAARFPFEVWIAGKQHGAEFLQADSGTFPDLAVLIKTVLTKIEKVLGEVPISLILHTAPLRCDVTEDCSYIPHAYHWHIEILPHAWPTGGFEWGGDFFLSPPTPEDCAKILAQTA